MDKQTILTLAALLLTSSAWGQSKQEGEVELSGGYGNTAPYASRLQLNLEEGKVVFKPFVGIKGLARHSSEQTWTSIISSRARCPCRKPLEVSIIRIRRLRLRG